MEHFREFVAPLPEKFPEGNASGIGDGLDPALEFRKQGVIQLAGGGGRDHNLDREP